MKSLIMVAVCCLFLSGCGNESPKEKVYLDDGTLGPNVVKSGPTLSWYNYRTGKHDHLYPYQEKDLSAYLPQITSVQGLYKTYVAMGDDPLKAFERALKDVIGAIERNSKVTDSPTSVKPIEAGLHKKLPEGIKTNYAMEGTNNETWEYKGFYYPLDALDKNGQAYFHEKGVLSDGKPYGQLGALKYILDKNGRPISEGCHKIIPKGNGVYICEIGALKKQLSFSPAP